MKKSCLKLYNVMFPIWFFFLYPTFLWLLILPVNFGVDSLVLFLGAKKLQPENRLQLWKKTIWKIWGFGFISDFIGAAISLCVMLLTDMCFPQLNTVLFPGSVLLALPGVAVAGLLIYYFNRYICFRKSELTEEQIHKLCLWLAVFTAPYTMLIPLYG